MTGKQKMHRQCQVNKSSRYPAQSLQGLRNIGPALEAKLRLIDVDTVSDFMKSEPEELYYRLQVILGQPVDRCVLYCFMGAKLNLPWPQCKKFFC